MIAVDFSSERKKEAFVCFSYPEQKHFAFCTSLITIECKLHSEMYLCLPKVGKYANLQRNVVKREDN